MISKDTDREALAALCLCGGACHHSDHPCSLGCWAAQRPWRAEEAAGVRLDRTPAVGDEGLRAALDEMRTYARHAPLCEYHPSYPDGPVATCDCGFDAVLERYAALAGGTPMTSDIDRLRALADRANYHVWGSPESYYARSHDRAESDLIAALDPDTVRALLDAAELGLAWQRAEDAKPCCFSLHEFEQVCPRTGTTFRLTEGDSR